MLMDMSLVPGYFRKCVAVALGGVFLGTQCLFAYQPEKGFWAERRRAAQRGASPLFASLPLGGQSGGGNSLAAQFPAVQSGGASLSQTVAQTIPKNFLKDHAGLFDALSPAHGTVRKVSLPQHLVPGSPVVIHIQDVHMNQEAQWNIRETVRGLMQAGQVDLIGLEGATGEIDLQPFVDFPSRRAVEVTADYLLKQNKITGPVHAAFTAHGTLPKILGIDDPLHYAANVRAYTDSSVRLDKTRQDVKVLQEEIEGRKKAVCSQELFAFDKEVRSYQKGEISLGDHVLNLTEKVPNNEAASIHSFKEALALERTLDFKQVEVERAALIAALTQRLNEPETKDLLAQSLAYRSGQLRYAEFYSHLKEMCQSKGLPLSRFPAMEAYVRYVLTADGIDGERLLEDIADLEKSAYDRLARSKAEKAFVAESRRAWLTKKLVEFSLTPADWKEYQATGTVGTKEELGSFESFYHEAHARDGAMAENLLRAIGLDGSTHTRTAVLVTGGYHAEGMTHRLVQQGAVVVSYVPKIEKIDTVQGSAYLSIFTQEKTPLEKLFAGQKLFLGYNPVAGVPEAVVLAPSVSWVENSSSRVISDGDRAKINGYLKRFYPAAKLTIGDPEQKKDGGWVVKVTVQVGEEKKNFSIVTNGEFDIEYFGIVGREERPPSAWFFEAVIWLHKKLGPYAEKVSPWTEAVLFSNLASWTPANFLWFARRHTVNNPHELSFLLAWMAIESFAPHVGQESRIQEQGVWERLRSSFERHEFWIGLGLFALAANRRGGTGKIKKQRNPSFKGDPGHKELELVRDSETKEGAKNGRIPVIVRTLVFLEGKYLVLKKKEKISGRLNKHDIPGGTGTGASGDASIATGRMREVGEELGPDILSCISEVSAQVGIKTVDPQSVDPIYSITGPNSNPLDRRLTTLSHLVLTREPIIKLSKEHAGEILWMPLAEILGPNFFPSLNTGPRMAFYVEFLREAYGLTGVVDLIPVNDDCRLKKLTDPVLIRTFDGKKVRWYLFSGKEDAISPQRMRKIHPELNLTDSDVPRIVDKKSLLSGWDSPQDVRSINTEEGIDPMVMRECELTYIPLRRPFSYSDLETSGGSEDNTVWEKQRGSLKTSLLRGLPKDRKANPSVRLIVKTSQRSITSKGAKYYWFAKVRNHKDECIGGMGPTGISRKRLIANAERQIQGRLGLAAKDFNGRLNVSRSPLITHSIESPDNIVDYRSVYDGVLILDNNKIRKIPKKSSNLVRLNYDQLKQWYYSFTLATRKVILKEIISAEYGLNVVSIRPLKSNPREAEFPLFIVTDRGNYVMREAHIEKNKEEELIKVLKHPNGSNGFYVQIGEKDKEREVAFWEKNYVLERASGNSKNHVSGETVQSSLTPSVPLDIMLPSIANKIKMDDIWGLLKDARPAIVQSRIDNPGIFSENRTSPVTEWDFKLQLLFMEMVQTYFPDAHVLGEENLLDEHYFKTLSEAMKERVIKVVQKNGTHSPTGLLFIVDPIDGTNAFTSGQDPHYAFTFCGLENGVIIYAATYLPDSGDLLEAFPGYHAILKNRVIVPPENAPTSWSNPFSEIVVQKGLKEAWETVYPHNASNPKISYEIPSMAEFVARIAAGEYGNNPAMVFGRKIPPWDSVPAAGVLFGAGYAVTTHEGEPFFEKLEKWIKEGKDPRKFIVSLMAARPGSFNKLKLYNDEALKYQELNRPYSLVEQSIKGTILGLVGIVMGFGIAEGILSGLVLSGMVVGIVVLTTLYGLQVWNGGRIINKFKSKKSSPNGDIEENSVQVIENQFNQFGFRTERETNTPNQFFVLIGNKRVTVRLPKDNDEMGMLLASKRLAQTSSGMNGTPSLRWPFLQTIHSHIFGVGGDAPEIVIVSNLSPLSLFFVVLTEIHRVSPTSVLGACVKWAISFASDLKSSALSNLRQIPALSLSLALIFAFVGVSGLLGNVFPFGQHIYEGNFPALAQLFPVFVLGNMKGQNLPPSEEAEKTEWGPNGLIDFWLLWGVAVNSISIGVLSAMMGLTFPAGEEKSRIQEEADSNVSGDADTIGNSRLPEHKEGSLQTELLASLPEGVSSLQSVRISVKLEVDGEAMYLTLKNKKFKDECPGGGVNEGETLLQAVLRELKEELGDDWKKIDVNLIKINEKPVLYHSITRPNGVVEYRTVHDVEISLNGDQLPHIDNEQVKNESETSNWVSYNDLKEKYDGFTLASRKVILARIIDKEYGLKAVFFRPLGVNSETNEFPLLITMDDGASFVLRELRKGEVVPTDKDGVQEKILKLTGRELILMPHSEGEHGYAGISSIVPMSKVEKSEGEGKGVGRKAIFSIAYWIARFRGAEVTLARRIGILGLFVEIPALVGFRLLAEDPLASGGGLFALLGYDPFFGPLLTVGIFVFAWGHYDLMTRTAKIEGDEPPTYKSFLGLVALFSLYLLPGYTLLGIGVAVHVVIDYYRLGKDNETPSGRSISATEVKKDSSLVWLVPFGRGPENAGKNKVQLLVTKTVNGQSYYFLQMKEDRWVCPEDNTSPLESPISTSPQFILKERRGDQFNFNIYSTRKVLSDEKSKLPFGNERGKWVTLDEVMNEKLLQCSLATRFAFLTEILDREYGIKDIVSIDPLESAAPTWVQGPPVMVTTQNGKKFIFRSAGRNRAQARFNLAVQTILEAEGIPVKAILTPKTVTDKNNPIVLRLARQSMVLEEVSADGKSVSKVDSSVTHFYKMGMFAGVINRIFENKKLHRNNPEHQLLVPIHLDNVKFDAEGNIVAIDLVPIPPGWGQRQDVLIGMGKGVGDREKLDAIIKGYEESGSSLTNEEKKDIWVEFNKETLKADFSINFNREKSDKSPSTLQWLWGQRSDRIGILDDVLNRAPWESAVIAILVGVGVWAHLGMGVSILFVVAVPLLAFVAGVSHYFGTYGMEGGVLKEVFGTPSLDKAMIWLVWTSAFAGGLLLVGHWVPSEYLNLVLSFATAAGARVSFLVHRKENRDWVVNNLPDLTVGQRDVAREVLIALEGRPLLLGVEDLRASVLRVAERYSRREGGRAVDLAALAGSLGAGNILFLVDPVSLADPSYVGKLNELLINDPGVLPVVPGKVSGLPEGRYLVVPGAFGAMDKSGNSLFEVALEKVESLLPQRVKNGPVRILQTPYLKLNYDNLSEGSEILKAKKSALVIILESMRAFSAETFRWGDVLGVMRALAEAA